MKKIITLTVALLLGVFSLSAKEKSKGAQLPPLKLGYVNFEYILEFLPDLKAAQSEIYSFGNQLKKHIAAKTEDLNKKEEAFKKDRKTMNESVRKQQELEIQRLKTSLRQFQEESSEKFTSKQNDLLGPIYGKVQNAITQVSKDHGYTFVLNASLGGMLLLFHADEEHDISDRVLRKLGIDPEKIGTESPFDGVRGTITNIPAVPTLADLDGDDEVAIAFRLEDEALREGDGFVLFHFKDATRVHEGSLSHRHGIVALDGELHWRKIHDLLADLLDPFEADAERVVVPIPDVAVHLQRLLHPELVLGRRLEVRTPIGDVLPEEHLERDPNRVEPQRAAFEREPPLGVVLGVGVPGAVFEVSPQQLPEIGSAHRAYQ